MDFAAPDGTPLMAPAAGTVSHVGYGDPAGWGFFIEVMDGRYTHIFAHLNDGASKTKVRAGDDVTEGQVLAATGDTGWSTGPHLHWQVNDIASGPAVMRHAVNPRTLINPQDYDAKALRDYAALAALRHGLDPHYFQRQINQESGWNMYAYSSANAIGIAQIVPRWHPFVNPWQPYDSLDYASTLMAGHLREFGRLDYALAAYNAGGSTVRQYGGVPPFPETERYVAVIMDGWEAPQVGDENDDIAMNRWIKNQMQDLAQEAIGMDNRLASGAAPEPDRLAYLNQRFADIRDNWAALWAAEKVRRNT
jgi:hypothetical protein